MIYAVNKYMDSIKVKQERETVPDFGGKRSDKYHYFDTEIAARDFIRKRAQTGVYQAEIALDKAVERSRKCYRKFPKIKLTEPSPAAGDSVNKEKS